MVPVVYRAAYQDYNFGPEHPFSPLRQQMLTDLLVRLGHDASAFVEPPPATREEVRSVHAEALVEQVEAASAGAARPEANQFGLGTMDVPVFDGMDDAARALVGGTLHAARMVADGEADEVLQLGGGLHHAQHALASGFCVYNDLSVAIRELRRRGLRVAYLDVDVHHGDGVQWIHYDERDVLTISLHEAGRYLFPGTGAVRELGEGDGHGYTLNVPLEPATTDASYLEAFEAVVPHALSWFQPDVLVVQCGADNHYRDPLADLLMTTAGFETLFRRIRDVVRESCGGRAVYTLGGGYDPDAAVRVWALLYLLLQDAELPRTLPGPWVSHWEMTLRRSLTYTLHDPAVAFDLSDERRSAIARQNHRNAMRLMETAAPLWY